MRLPTWPACAGKLGRQGFQFTWAVDRGAHEFRPEVRSWVPNGGLSKSRRLVPAKPWRSRKPAWRERACREFACRELACPELVERSKRSKRSDGSNGAICPAARKDRLFVCPSVGLYGPQPPFGARRPGGTAAGPGLHRRQAFVSGACPDIVGMLKIPRPPGEPAARTAVRLVSTGFTVSKQTHSRGRAGAPGS